MAYTSRYADQIKKLAPTYDPRHIEAFMRVGHGTLDKLSTRQFRAEVKLSTQCIDSAGLQDAEDCAKSYGL